MKTRGAIRIVANSVSAFVFRRRRDGYRFLLLRRSRAYGGYWQSVSGRVRSRERAEAAAARETLEETGLRATRVTPIDFINAYYDDGRIYLEPCFGVEVGDGEVRLSKEHVEYRWASASAAARLLHWPGNRAAFDCLVQELRRTPRVS